MNVITCVFKMMLYCVAVVLCVGFVSGKVLRTEVIHWTREVVGRQKIDERAEVYVNKQIRMFSDDDILNKFNFHRSESWHDYETGTLAIKFIDAVSGEKPPCFLTNVKKSYDETLEDLNQRNGKTIPAVGERKFIVTSDEEVDAPSATIKEFCKDSPIYPLRESRLSQGNPDDDVEPIVPMIVRTYCFYGDIDLYFPYNFLKLIFTIFPFFNL